MSVWVPDTYGEYSYAAISGYTMVVGPDDEDGTWWAWATWGYGPNVHDTEVGTGYSSVESAMKAAEEWLHHIEEEEKIAYEQELAAYYREEENA